MFSVLCRRLSIASNRPSIRRCLCTETLAPSFGENTSQKHTDISSTEKATSQAFSTLLRNSPFTQLGNPVGKVNITIFDIVLIPLQVTIRQFLFKGCRG